MPNLGRTFGRLQNFGSGKDKNHLCNGKNHIILVTVREGRQDAPFIRSGRQNGRNERKGDTYESDCRKRQKAAFEDSGTGLTHSRALRN